ncbi:MAG: hypothetical protein Q9183_004482, partial [Haloplaca sp. 2 TL-2023]
EYVDPSGIYPVISSDLHKNLPLRNLYWNSATRPLRSIASLHIELVKSGTRDTPSSSASHEHPIHNGVAELDEQHGQAYHNTRPASSTTAKKARRHQIPGLRQTPYLKIFFLRCSDVESYRNVHRKQIREWVKENTPLSQSTASINTQEFHDAFEWLIVHVVLPDDGRSISRASGSSKKNLHDGPQSSFAVTEKVRADFNGSSKAAVDRVAQVQITRDSDSGPVPGKEQASVAGWEDFVTKTKSLVLSSFDLRVTQYEEDIKERDSQRNVPGWNFNTFFVLKEGLARGFESVGLIEDALTGYHELVVGLTSIIETKDAEEQRGDHFKAYTDDLSAELKHALQSEKPQDHQDSDSSTAGAVATNGEAQTGRNAPGSDVLNVDRKPFRELILANDISIFDFCCYVFAREVSLLLRLANSNLPRDDDEESEAQDLLHLAEICRRAIEFFTAAGRMIREDLRSSIHPLSKGRANASPSSLSPFEGSIEDIVACWMYSASQCILNVTDVSSLTTQLEPLHRNLKPSEPAKDVLRGSANSLAHGDLPRRTSSLPLQAPLSPKAPDVDDFPTVTSLDATRLLPPTSPQGGSQELAAQRAELVSFQRRILMELGNRRCHFSIPRLGLESSRSANQEEMEDVSLNDADAGDGDNIPTRDMSTATSTKGLGHPYLDQTMESEGAYTQAFEQLSHFYHNNDWARLEMPMLDMYAQCLQQLDRKLDFCRIGLQILAKSTRRPESLLHVSGGPLHADSEEMGHYLADVVEASKSLQRSISAPLQKHFGRILLGPCIRHFDDRDGFHMTLSLQNLMPVSVMAEEIRVKLVNVDNDQRSDIWLKTGDPSHLRPGMAHIDVQTTVGQCALAGSNWKESTCNQPM